LQAVAEYLQLLGMTIDKHPKSSISKNVSSLSTIFLQALDFRRQYRAEDQSRDVPSAEADRIQDAVNMVALQMIYKLNDAVFRPIFSQLMDWAKSGLAKNDAVGRRLRQESVFAFLAAFFENLKSIVTSYASYMVENATTILKETDVRKVEERELWKRVLRALSRSFEHDQDGFWQAPAHFSAVAPVLLDQFSSAAGVAGVDVEKDLVPALVELAAAVESKEHHKELNGALLKLMRAEQPAIRLAVIKCQQALTRRLGEEWLQALPEMLPYISELQDDDDEIVEKENRRWIVGIEEILGESLDSMLQ
jgi:U3 small nucleolar RNA-associated protein 10